MAVPKKRTTSCKTRMRRSHHHQAVMNLAICSNCGAQHIQHNICDHCGFYKGKIVKKKKLVTKADK